VVVYEPGGYLTIDVPLVIAVNGVRPRKRKR
jgi:hypothetical protein